VNTGRLIGIHLGLDVVAIHNHMIGTQPAVIFLNYWGRGPADS